MAGFLERLRVGQKIKSRPRHSNDNGLVETKNGALVRIAHGLRLYRVDGGMAQAAAENLKAKQLLLKGVR